MTQNNIINKINIASSGVNADITALHALTGTIKAPTAITSAADETLAGFNYIASAVNFLQFFNAIAGHPPVIYADGTDFAIPLQLGVKNSYIGIYDWTNTIPAYIRMFNAASSFYVGIKCPAGIGADVDFTLPAVDGAAGAVMQTDGSGNLSLNATATKSDQNSQTGSAVVTTNVQFNHGSACKAWANINSDGSINDSYNIASINNSSAGQYDVTLTTAMGNTSYAAVALYRGGGQVFCATSVIDASNFSVFTYSLTGIQGNAPINIIVMGHTTA